MKPSKDISRLYEIMAALRDPKTGCAWDLEQDFASIKQCTIEEAYEVADAIERQDYVDLQDELGDLLLQPVFHAHLAKEKNLFDIGDVIYSITEKLIRRHPHVFGDMAGVSGSGAIATNGDLKKQSKDPKAAKESWDRIKQIEKTQKLAKKGLKESDLVHSILDDVPKPLPALTRADKLAKQAATVGFDWPDWQTTFGKCTEELDEIKDAINNVAVGRFAPDPDTPAIKNEKGEQAIKEEIGDAFFALANLARHLDIDPEAALRDANQKFTRRFAYVEKRCKQDNIAIEKAGLEQLDEYWNEIRTKDKI